MGVDEGGMSAGRGFEAAVTVYSGVPVRSGVSISDTFANSCASFACTVASISSSALLSPPQAILQSNTRYKPKLDKLLYLAIFSMRMPQ